jgi:glucose-1-phosphate thymidylyltransferase
MKALILSGGKGTRLQPITYTYAKQLVPVANKPVLFYALETIIAAGIVDIGIIVGETGAEIQAAVKDGKAFGANVSITYIHQEQALGLAHAVKTAQAFLGDERFLMFLGDNFIEEDISQVVQGFAAPNNLSQAQIFLKQVPNPHQFGVAELCTHEGQPITDPAILESEDIYIQHLVEKPREPISDFALVGIYLFDAHIFEAVDAIQPSPRGELEITDAIQYLIDHNYTVRPHIITGYWIDTGQMQDMLDANRVILSHARRSISLSASIDQQSQVYGDVILGENVRVINSIVRGPSAIGCNVVLTNAYIGPFTAIAHDSVVTSSEIEHSIVLEGCRISNIEGRIEDSLIGRHAEIYLSPNKPKAYKLLLGDHSRIGIL